MDDAEEKKSFFRVEGEGLADGLEGSGLPAIVLDQIGRVIYRTATISHFLNRDFRIAEGLLRGIDAATESAFQNLAEWARGKTSTPDNFLIHRTTASRALLLAMPIKRIFYDDRPRTAQSIVAFLDLGQKSKPPFDQLRALFNLTDAEASVAIQIGMGMTIVEAAFARGVATSTVRGQLKVIFRKLNLKRQSDIVRVVHRIGWASAPLAPRNDPRS